MPLARAGTETEVANGALGLAEQPPIGSIDGTEARARAVKGAFAEIRDGVLAEHYWNFAKAWAVPSLNGTPSIGPLTKRYPMPNDCIAIRSVDGLEEDEWDVEASDLAEAKILVTNATAPKVCYTKLVDNPRYWDPLFLTVFQLRLAARIIPIISKNTGLAGDRTDEADDLIAQAKRVDAREGARSTITRDTSWVAARRSGFRR